MRRHRSFFGSWLAAICGPLLALGLIQTVSAQTQTNLLRFTFDEASSGTTPALDVSGNAPISGTFVGGATRTTTTPGSYPTAALDNGAGTGFLDAGDVDRIDGLQKITMTGWLRVSSAPVNGQSIMGKLDAGSTSGYSLLFGPPSGGTIGANNFSIKFKVAGTTSGNSGDLNANNAWIFVAVVYDGSLASANVKFYTGDATTAVAQSSTTKNNAAGTAVANTNSFRVCASASGATPTSLMMDDVRVYNGLLALADLEAVRLANVPPTTTLYWDRNGSTAGTGSSTPNGVWSGSGVLAANNNWSSSSAGNIGVQQWTDGNAANFSAGTDGSGSYTVTISNAPTASGITVDEGTVLFNKSQVTLVGSATIDVASGASATFDSTTLSSTVGMTKTSAGTLILGKTNSSLTGTVTLGAGTLTVNSGATLCASTAALVVNGGTLNLNNTAQTVTSVSGSGGTIALGSGHTLTVTPGTFSLASAQTLKGNGSVAGVLSLAGTVAPGASVGTLTTTGAALLQSGGTDVVEVIDANGTGGTGYDLLSVSGDIGVLSTSGSPFNIKLVSFNGSGTAGNVTNFNNNTSYTWTIATGNVTNFAANKFTVDSTSFSNDLAGGEFVIEPGSLNVRFTNNHAPACALATYSRGTGTTLKIKKADLVAAFTSDPDGDGRSLTLVDATSTNSVNVTTDSDYIYYTNNVDVTDRFGYTVRDVRAAYRAGDTVRTASGTIEVHVVPTVSSNSVVALQANTPGMGTNTISFAGIPGYQYVVQFSTNLTDWEDLSTNTASPSNGQWTVEDDTATNAMRFYRSVRQ